MKTFNDKRHVNTHGKKLEYRLSNMYDDDAAGSWFVSVEIIIFILTYNFNNNNEIDKHIERTKRRTKRNTYNANDGKIIGPRSTRCLRGRKKLLNYEYNKHENENRKLVQKKKKTTIKRSCVRCNVSKSSTKLRTLVRTHAAV